MKVRNEVIATVSKSERYIKVTSPEVILPGYFVACRKQSYSILPHEAQVDSDGVYTDGKNCYQTFELIRIDFYQSQIPGIIGKGALFSFIIPKEREAEFINFIGKDISTAETFKFTAILDGYYDCQIYHDGTANITQAEYKGKIYKF